MVFCNFDYPWIRLIRRTDKITIVYVDLTPGELHEQHAIDWLDESELKRIQRYRISRPQREFALCRAALRCMLCEQLGCENDQLSFAAENYGKPYALVNRKPVPINFNVSHSDPHGLVTITHGMRVGIDVETTKYERDFDGIASVVFGPNERVDIASVSGIEKAHLFLRFWTLKEAVVKALGTGLATDLTEFEISPDIRHGARRSVIQLPMISDTWWVLEDLSTPDYTAAIASEIIHP